MKVDIFRIRAQVMVALTLILLFTCVSTLHAGPRIKPGLRVSLLGIDGLIFVGHGRSDSLAIMNAIKVANNAVQNNLLKALSDAIQIQLQENEG